MPNPLNSSLEDLHSDLRRIYTIALPRYEAKYPLGAKISPNETSRNALIQNAYYAQGRVNLKPLNDLRARAGLWPLKLEEAKHVISNAKYGQSSHNFKPSRALDVQATDAQGKYIGGKLPYFLFWLEMEKVAKELLIEIVWGGTWKDWPHIELKHWRTMK